MAQARIRHEPSVAAPAVGWRGGSRPVPPMLAALTATPLTGDGWVYEPSHGGIRTLVAVEPGTARGGVRLWSRIGTDETAKFPEIAAAFGELARRLKAPILVDGEIVALDDAGEPTRLQRRPTRVRAGGRGPRGQHRAPPVAFVAFDVLRDGDLDVRPLPLTVRRARLERILKNVGATVVRLSDFVAGDGRALYRQAAERGWTGVVAKRLDSPYRSGRRSPDWRTITIARRQAARESRSRAPIRPATAPSLPLAPALAEVVHQLEAIEQQGDAGTVRLPGGVMLDVSHLDRVLWPSLGVTKAELMRYYVAISPLVLPVVADRPLVMQRFPAGVGRASFYQQHAPPDAPAGVRVERLPGDRVVPSRLIGGSLATLLYMVQRGVIAQDPWLSRVGSLDTPDHAVLDLDPMPGVSFDRVIDVARWVRDELDRIGVPSMPKTSGASGAHVYVPLPPGTTYETARLFCQIVATTVASRHPTMATVERAIDAHGRRVYVDYLQNTRGKTVAAAYSVRATPDAGVSTPLTWSEVDAGVDRGDFTLPTIPRRLREVGDLWAALRTSPGADLAAILRR